MIPIELIFLYLQVISYFFAIIVAGFAIRTYYLNFKVNEVKLLRDFFNDISESEDKSDDLVNNGEDVLSGPYERWERRFVNKVEFLAFLVNSKKISLKSVLFFKEIIFSAFESAKSLQKKGDNLDISSEIEKLVKKIKSK